MNDFLTCPECGSHEVHCVCHPTAHGWHVFECSECGFEGGEHKPQPHAEVEVRAYHEDLEVGW